MTRDHSAGGVASHLRRKLGHGREILGHLAAGEVGHFALEVLNRVPEGLLAYRRATLMRAQRAQASRMLPPTIRLRWVEPAELPQVSMLTGQPLSALRARLAAGDRCLVGVATADRGAAIVHARWAHVGPCYVRSLGYELAIEPNGIYGYAGYTARDHRQGGIASNSLSELQRRLSPAGGLAPMYTFSEDWNRPACLHHERSNFAPVVHVSYLAWSGLKVTRIADAASGRAQMRCFVRHRSAYPTR